MYKIEETHPNESEDKTLSFINSKDNWNVEKQEYRGEEYLKLTII